jgi:hypothetical protein
VHGRHTGGEAIIQFRHCERQSRAAIHGPQVAMIAIPSLLRRVPLLARVIEAA